MIDSYGGTTLRSSADMEAPVGSINNEIEMLSKDISLLEESYGVLYQKIQPILGPQSPEKAVENTKSGIPVQLAQMMRNLRDRINALTEFVQSTNRRVEL